jgi:hypothetical protein
MKWKEFKKEFEKLIDRYLERFDFQGEINRGVCGDGKGGGSGD